MFFKHLSVNYKKKSDQKENKGKERTGERCEVTRKD